MPGLRPDSAQPSDRATRKGQWNVLLCLGDLTVRPLMRAICRATDFDHVYETETAKDAFRTMLIDEKPVDVIICGPLTHLDTGIKLAKAIRKSSAEAIRQLPIIMVSTAAVVEDIIAARDAGVTEFLTLPVSSEMLMTRIAHSIAHPREFVVTGDYSGPDRRRLGLPPRGEDRRKRPPESSL
ncbi:response regulator [Tepidicaulis marinus]|nr:response regulator [Tepidicaulis marinus]